MRAAAEKKTAAAIVKSARQGIEKLPGARIDYVELVDAESLEPVKNLRQPMRLAVAVFLGKARLIDNIPVSPRT
jgi:pantoate--beta-alanine ligase